MTFKQTLALCVSSALLAAAQSASAYTDPATGIKLQAVHATGNAKGGFQFGIALPEASAQNKDDYIGNIIGARVNGQGWSGVSHDGGMLNALLLVAWADGNDIKTSLRIASGYKPPVLYAGAANVKVTPLSKTVNATHINLVYRCQGCFNWEFNGKKFSQPPSNPELNFGWAQSSKAVKTPSYPSSPIQFHDNGYGVVTIGSKAAIAADFDAQASKAAPAAAAAAPAAAAAAAAPKMVRRRPQVGAAITNGTTVALPTFSSVPSPALGTAQPKIPVPISSAPTAIPAILATASPTPVAVGVTTA